MTTQSEPFIVEGFLIGADQHRVELVMPPYLLEIARPDVLGIEERPALPQQNTAFCVAARLELRPGAGLLRMRSAADLEARMWTRRRPFAMVTRPPNAALLGEAAYAQREREFFAGLGLED